MISRSRKGGKHKGSKSIASCEVVRRSGPTLRGMLAKLQNDYAADGVSHTRCDRGRPQKPGTNVIRASVSSRVAPRVALGIGK